MSAHGDGVYDNVDELKTLAAVPNVVSVAPFFQRKLFVTPISGR